MNEYHCRYCGRPIRPLTGWAIWLHTPTGSIWCGNGSTDQAAPR